jgi:hypothetical protein
MDTLIRHARQAVVVPFQSRPVAIRLLPVRYFAARGFADVADLNSQSAWCQEGSSVSEAAASVGFLCNQWRSRSMSSASIRR